MNCPSKCKKECTKPMDKRSGWMDIHNSDKNISIKLFIMRMKLSKHAWLI